MHSDKNFVTVEERNQIIRRKQTNKQKLAERGYNWLYLNSKHRHFLLSIPGKSQRKQGQDEVLHGDRSVQLLPFTISRPDLWKAAKKLPLWAPRSQFVSRLIWRFYSPYECTLSVSVDAGHAHETATESVLTQQALHLPLVRCTCSKAPTYHQARSYDRQALTSSPDSVLYLIEL